MTWLRSEGIHPLPALDGGLGKSAGEKVAPEETLLPGKLSATATIQKVRRSEGQKVRRSEGQKVRRSEGQKVRRSEGQKVRRSDLCLVSGFRVFLAAGLPVRV